MITKSLGLYYTAKEEKSKQNTETQIGTKQIVEDEAPAKPSQLKKAQLHNSPRAIGNC